MNNIVIMLTSYGSKQRKKIINHRLKQTKHYLSKYRERRNWGIIRLQHQTDANIAYDSKQNR